MFEHLTTRSRIFVLVIASGLPLILLSIFIALEQRSAAEVRAREEIQHHAQLIAAMLDGAQFEHLPAPGAFQLGPGEEVAIIDERARIIARYPPKRPLPDEHFAAPRVLENIAKGGGPVVEQKDRSGTLRLYAVRTAFMERNPVLLVNVLVSVPKSVIYQPVDHALAETLAGIAVLTILLIAVAWYGAERLVRRPLRTMLDVVGRVRAGDFSARTGMRESDEELSQLAAGLDHMAEQLEIRDARAREMLEELRSQAVTDSLTGLYNRRYFWDALTRELIAARRKAARFSIILIDLDHFKDVNDTWGHGAGDVVLQAVADLLRSSVRGSDIAVRYGGEEFALLLPGTKANIAEARAETLRRELHACEIVYGTETIRITASFGVVEWGDTTHTAAQVMRCVDAALYAAKEAGRNTVFVYAPTAAATDAAGTGSYHQDSSHKVV